MALQSRIVKHFLQKNAKHFVNDLDPVTRKQLSESLIAQPARQTTCRCDDFCKRRTKICKSCGFINDIHSRYCGNYWGCETCDNHLCNGCGFKTLKAVMPYDLRTIGICNTCFKADDKTNICQSCKHNDSVKFLCEECENISCECKQNFENGERICDICMWWRNGKDEDEQNDQE